MVVNYGAGGGHFGAATEYYVPSQTTFDMASELNNLWSSASPQRNGIQFIPVAGTGVTWFNFTVVNAAFTFTGPSGVYYINQGAGCSTPAFSSCSAPNPNTPGFAPYVIVGESILPVNGPTSVSTGIAASFNLTGPSSGQQVNTVLVACGPQLGNGFTTISAPETNAVNVYPCGHGAVNYTIPEMETFLQAALNVGDAYWAFLRAQGYTNVDQVPTRCVIPNPADIITPNVSGGAAYLASLNLSQILALYYGYLGSLSQTFNATTNLTSFGFCGEKVRCPDGSTDLTACEGIVGLGQAPVIALGSIYVPPAQCVADLGHACNGEVIGTPSTWGIVNVQILWEPSTGTFTAVLNQTMELPYANPLQVIYTTNNSTTGSLTCQTGAFNVFGCSPTLLHNQSFGVPSFLFHVTGNSTDGSGSVYPTDTNSSLEAHGFATVITACASITLASFNGVWTEKQNYTRQTAACDFNETEIQSWVTNYTCIWDTADCVPPPPPPPPSNGGLCGTGGLTAWYDGWIGAIVSGIAAPFQSSAPLIGGLESGLGCVLGWAAVIAIFVILVIAIIFVIRFVRGR